MNRQRIYAAVVCFLALVVPAKIANAQSKDRDNPTPLASNVILGLVDSDSRGNYYFYSFMVNPGEVSITLTVEPGRKANDSQFISFTGVSFSLYDRNAAELAGKEVSTADNTGSRQAVARVEITRRQLLVLGIHVPDKSPYNSVGGKYRVRIEGAVGIDSNKSSSKDTSSSGLSQADIDASFSSKRGECLPKRGTLIIKMKDGSKKIIDLSEAETVTVVP